MLDLDIQCGKNSQKNSQNQLRGLMMSDRNRLKLPVLNSSAIFVWAKLISITAAAIATMTAGKNQPHHHLTEEVKTSPHAWAESREGTGESENEGLTPHHQWGGVSCGWPAPPWGLQPVGHMGVMSSNVVSQAGFTCSTTFHEDPTL